MNLSEYFGVLAQGAVTTATLSLSSICLAAVLAISSGLTLFASRGPLRVLALAYVEIFRGTSLLVQLFWLYYALPLLGFSMPPFLTGVVALALNTGAYGAEVVRGALQSVPNEQHEAARALNFSRTYTLRKIVLPQALREMLPPFSSLAVQNLKDTALVSMITIADLAFKAQELRNLTQDSVTIYSLALGMYFAMALVIVVGLRVLEGKLDPLNRARTKL
jgi:polar amino acid transport system permease protein